MSDFNALLQRLNYLNHPYISAAIGILGLIFGLFVFYKDRRSPINRTFLMLTYTLFHWFFFNSISMVNYARLDRAILWMRIAYVSVPFMSFSYYYFYTVHLNKKKTFAYICLFISILESLYMVLTKDVYTNAHALYNVGVYWTGMTRLSWIALLNMTKYLFLSLLTGISYFIESRKETILLRKKQYQWFGFLFLVCGMGWSEWLAFLGVPLHIAWVLGIPFFGILSYTIINYKIMETETVIHKTILWAVTITLLVLPGLWSIIHLNRWLNITNPTLHYPLLTVYFILYLNVYNYFRPRIDHFFRRKKYEYQTVLGKIAERIATSININELTPRLLTEISEAMYLRNALLYVIDKNETKFFLTGRLGYEISLGIKKEKKLHLYEDGKKGAVPVNQGELDFLDPLCQWLINSKEILEREQVEINPRFAEIKNVALSLFYQLEIEVLVPIVFNEKVNALLGLGKKENLQAFNEKDIELLKKLSQEAGVTVFNTLHFKDLAEKERLEEEMKMGQQIQRTLIPKDIPDVTGLKISGFMNSAKEIGGDYYDFLPQSDPDSLGIVIGDVTGKGVAAGLCMAIVKPVIHIFSQKESSPKDILIQVNQILNQHIGGDRFMTLLYLIWQASDSTITYSSAGHEHILVYRQAQKEVEEMECGGIILGVMPDIRRIVEEQKIILSKGDKVLLFTDGVTEAHNQSKDRFGILRLKDSLKKYNSLSSQGILQGIKEDIFTFMDTSPQYDDITLVVLDVQ